MAATLTTIPKQINLATLEPILVQSKIQSDNPALYQVIWQLLKKQQQINDTQTANISTVNTSGGSSTGGLTEAQIAGRISLRIL